MNTCFETLNHQELGLASQESPVRLRVRLSYDAHAECPLEWDHGTYGGKKPADPAQDNPPVRFIIFDKASTLEKCHPFSCPSAVLASYHPTYKGPRHKVYLLHGHSGARGGQASFWASKHPLKITNGLHKRFDNDAFDLRDCEDACGFVVVDTHQVGAKRDKATGRFKPMKQHWQTQANQQCALVKAWCNGEFCQYDLEQGTVDPDTDEVEDWECVDACCGFSGADHARQEALDSARNHWGKITKTPESL